MNRPLPKPFGSAMSPPTLDELRQHPPMRELTDAQLLRLRRVLTVHEYHDGERILREGDLDLRAFMLHRGGVRFTKRLGKQEHVINELQAPSGFGELAFIDRQPRTASAYAVGPTLAFSLDLDLAATDPESQLLVMREISRLAVARLSHANTRHVEESDRRERFGKLTILVMIVMSMMTCVAGFAGSGGALDGVPMFVVAPMLMISMIWIAVAAVRLTQRPARTFGLTLSGWRRSLGEGAVISAVLVGIYSALGFGVPLPKLVQTMASSPRWLAYVLVAVLQELFCRGILQTSFQTFYKDERGVVAVLLTSLVYAVSHAYIGLGATVGSFALGLLLGFLYLRHRNLLGVVLIHYVAGTLALGLGLLNA